MFKLFNRKKKTVEEEYVPPVKTELYLLLDVPKNGIIQYFESMGIKVADIFYSIEDAQFGLMGNSELHRRLVVVESGAGIFGRKENREALIDIVGMVDSTLDATLFYTDTGMKTDIHKSLKDRIKKLNQTMAKEDKIQDINIDYVMYESMSTVVNQLNKYNEAYVLDGAEDITIQNPLEYTAREIPNSELLRHLYFVRYNDLGIVEALRKAIDANVEGEGLQGFDVVI